MEAAGVSAACKKGEDGRGSPQYIPNASMDTIKTIQNSFVCIRLLMAQLLFRIVLKRHIIHDNKTRMIMQVLCI
jgi:hypothetical protein